METINAMTTVENHVFNDGFDLVSTPAYVDTYRAAYMRFRKGQFLLGVEQQPVPPGTEYVALQASEAWVRLEKGVPPTRVPRKADKPFPRRDELGDVDQKFWPVFADKLSDPWSHTLELLLVERETGRPVIFSVGTTTGKPAVEDLCRLVVFQRRSRGPKAKPIIKLKVGTLNLKVGPVLVPQFEISGWIDSGELGLPELKPTQLAQDLTDRLEAHSIINPKAKRTGEPARRKKKAAPMPWESDDLDDEIPI